MEFKTAQIDRISKLTTIFLGLVMIVVFTYFILMHQVAIAVFFPIIAVVFLISYLFIPKIHTEQRKLVISNTYRTIEIPVQNIREITLVPRGTFFIRTFGVGGVFGQFGYFNKNEFWLVTNRDKRVKIVVGRKTYVISPEEPKKLISHIMHLKDGINY